jgi:DNA-binding response OmpR family regulator
LTISEDRAFQAALAARLRGAGLEVLPARSRRQAVDRAQLALPAVVVVDDRLTKADPLDLCRQVRGVLGNQQGAVILLSSPDARGAPPASKFHAAAVPDLGPLTRSIVALVGSTDRSTTTAASVIALAGLEMDRRRMRAAVDGRELRLTATEFRLVWTLARKAGYVFSRQQLCEACCDSSAPVHARTIDVHIRTIRQKLADRAALIETVRGAGYRFFEPARR